CPLRVDLVLRSSNGVLFGVHSTNLADFAAGFPPVEFMQQGGTNKLEIVQLTETDAVLHILLQYMHHQRQPDSSHWSFETFESVAEAAEKYEVYGALEVCRLQMKANIAKYPRRVLPYAVKHGYPELRDLIIPTTLAVPLQEMEPLLVGDSRLFLAWVSHYREQYLEFRSGLLRLIQPSSCSNFRGVARMCPEWTAFQKEVLDSTAAFHNGLTQLQKFSKLVDSQREKLSECSACRTRASDWANAETLAFSGFITNVDRAGLNRGNTSSTSTRGLCPSPLAFRAKDLLYVVDLSPQTVRVVNFSTGSDACKLPVDVILRSSDGKLLGAHLKNLEMFSEGFPPASFATTRSDNGKLEIVPLTEDSKTLELLLQYIHNQRHPDLSKIGFTTVANVAEAAEKYFVYCAMDACKSQMKLSVQAHPLEVLSYATTHNYKDLREEAAPLTVSISLDQVQRVLAPSVLLAWVNRTLRLVHLST
ncbi:hypothetical protein C8F01DRAFT_970452, partial [Mycena amicta]